MRQGMETETKSPRRHPLTLLKGVTLAPQKDPMSDKAALSDIGSAWNTQGRGVGDHSPAAWRDGAYFYTELPMDGFLLSKAFKK